MQNNIKNIYIPTESTILEIRQLTQSINAYIIKAPRPVPHKPGQFFMISVFGYGEVPISIASTEDEQLMFCIKKVGHVTGAIHLLKPGDRIGIRGPYGRPFPLDIAEKKDIIVLAGGIGIIPLRPLIHELASNKKRYGRKFLLYGCKGEDKLFEEEINDWEAAGFETIYGLRGKKSVDPDGVCTYAPHNVSIVEAETDLSNAVAYVCGPQNMIDLSMMELSTRGMPKTNIITSLEAHMKCGVGKCGHCYKGSKYICTDGPVFSMQELSEISLE